LEEKNTFGGDSVMPQGKTMIRLSQTEVVTTSGAITKLAEEFEATGIATLPGFLAPPILTHLMGWLEKTRFVEKHEVGPDGVFGTTLFVPETEGSWFLLQFILNRPELFEIARKVAGCPKIANFMGRLHRTGVEANQHIDWHRDAIESRTLGICIHLSSEEYTGGVFQLRDECQRLRAEAKLRAPGDAFLFRIDREWQHRLTPVESGRRTVGVGWFRTQPKWQQYALSVARSRQIILNADIVTAGPMSGLKVVGAE
jgi:hypothetical protein